MEIRILFDITFYSMKLDFAPCWLEVMDGIKDYFRTEEAIHILARMWINVPTAGLVYVISELNTILSRVS